MHKRHNAQRQHIIYSLDTLLFQLHTLSFFLSPSLLGFISRLFSQFQCSKPRDIDPTRSLRFWFFMLVFFNSGTIWSHATEGAAEGRAVVLDFVGQAYKPTKFHLLLLDAVILCLQLVLTTIAYEAHIISRKPSNASFELSSPFPASLVPSTPTLEDVSKTPFGIASLPESPYIVDLHFSHILERLRNPAPPTADPDNDDLIPLPNTTSWPLPSSFRMLMQARAEVRRRTQVQTRTQAGQTSVVPAPGNPDGSRRVPGGMDADDAG